MTFFFFFTSVNGGVFFVGVIGGLILFVPPEVVISICEQPRSVILALPGVAVSLASSFPVGMLVQRSLLSATLFVLSCAANFRSNVNFNVYSSLRRLDSYVNFGAVA